MKPTQKQMNDIIALWHPKSWVDQGLCNSLEEGLTMTKMCFITHRLTDDQINEIINNYAHEIRFNKNLNKIIYE